MRGSFPWRTRGAKGHTHESAVDCIEYWRGRGLRKQICEVDGQWWLEHVHVPAGVLEELENEEWIFRSGPDTYDS